jgi:L-ascorbate metabolism protein UlaG (beta-lactamase superfamily)
MKITFKTRHFLLFLFLLLAKIGVSQNGEINIKFIGNCGMHLTDGDLNIYVDFPYKSGFFNYMEYDKYELDSIREHSIFIFTHKHPDHYSPKQMRKTLRKKHGHKYGKWNLNKLQQMCDSIDDFSIQAIKTEHSLSFKHYSYLMTWHGKRFYISGDEETPDHLLSLKDLDWAFIPYWLNKQVNEQDAEIDATMIAINHFYPIMQVTNGRPDRIKILNKTGERIKIPY